MENNIKFLLMIKKYFLFSKFIKDIIMIKNEIVRKKTKYLFNDLLLIIKKPVKIDTSSKINVKLYVVILKTDDKIHNIKKELARLLFLTILIFIFNIKCILNSDKNMFGKSYRIKKNNF